MTIIQYWKYDAAGCIPLEFSSTWKYHTPLWSRLQAGISVYGKTAVQHLVDYGQRPIHMRYAHIKRWVVDAKPLSPVRLIHREHLLRICFRMLVLDSCDNFEIEHFLHLFVDLRLIGRGRRSSLASILWTIPLGIVHIYFQRGHIRWFWMQLRCKFVQEFVNEVW